MNNSLDPRAEGSRLVQRLRRRYAAHLLQLPAGTPNPEMLARCFSSLQIEWPDPADALRVLRQLVMERLVVLDCEQQAPLQTVTQTMTWLAEFSLDLALQEATQRVALRHGLPRTPQGNVAQLWIVGMGKLGAAELNVSSDIDLIYIYDEEGQTQGLADGSGVVDNQVFFDRVVKQLYTLIGDTTEHGFVFRMDLALRPNGESGPSVVSLAALEEYFQVQGREWERLAWLKARVVAPAACIDQVPALRDIITPFVFRRYLDYNVFEALRVLHQQIRLQSQRRSATRPERANDVKLGRGGIREIEFTVQLLQVVRGGQFPELRMRPTLQALTALVQARLMPAETALALQEAYVFLRQVEHRIQYLDDQQTHQLPTNNEDLHWIAQSMGWPDNAALQAPLQRHRDAVALEFERLLRNEDDSPNTAQSSTPTDFEMLLEGLSPELHGRIARWAELPRVLALRDEALQRLLKLVQRTQSWVTQGVISETAAVRWSDWMEPLLRRETYLALLLERPSVHAQLLRLLGAARWPARYLMKHPGVIDELADPSMLNERFDAPLFKQNLQTRYQALQSAQADDDESLLNLLRRAHHAELFLTLTRDLEGHLSVEQVADDLSALADAIVEVAASWVWPLVKTRHRETPCFAVIGYGKWGGKELGYGSDLDIVFVFQDEHPQAPEIYALFARKLIQWLTLKTGEGDVYEIDTALRPNGSAGLLVSSMDAFAEYQAQRGSNSAWVWEHQAMTRARFCVGDRQLGAQFEAVRRQVLCAPRDLAQLALDIMAMREKMRTAHSVPAGLFDFKHSVGGMIDLEFAVQFLVLAHAHAHPSLQDNMGNIALLHRAEAAGLLPKGLGVAAADAYRELRHLQHQARLDEQVGRSDAAPMQGHSSAIQAVWSAVFH
ncbi:MAG: bifunctional [glutamate--ammonia ligase]-adenylyl-L-tyrosine phosphorylase/[glutamate--ammonia-ligase] adenylyltransferase [Limnohabitans sp.]|jgi:glutamate-ammonia-ligase adenylyltransferase|nr:bifunctional [glutamate--ammonia ligase]-adenylyl-L-tyrosine phosphorylase/[glutamate--ammonia-ligase] adenylyltransferase [Limnohabitans sp.]